jgi:hypothetical protein
MDDKDSGLSDEILAFEEGDLNDVTMYERGASKPRKNRRKLWLIFGVLVALMVVSLGTGAWVWHGEPTFCNAFCHEPMDSYVEGYLSDDSALLVMAHKDDELECLDCHETNVAQQIEEFGKWVTGDFSDPMAMTKTGTREFCSRTGCHDDYEAIQAATVDYNGSARNPHDSHYGDSLECYSCHRVHRDSTLYCNECHSDIVPLETWAMTSG